MELLIVLRRRSSEKTLLLLVWAVNSWMASDCKLWTAHKKSHVPLVLERGSDSCSIIEEYAS